MLTWKCCWSKRNRVSPELVEDGNSTEHLIMAQPEQPCPLEVSSNAADYEFYQTIGQGWFGSLDIKLSRVNNMTVVVRQFNLEVLQLDQLIELQHEMCISQLVNHPHVIKCFTSFVHGHHLWAIQELMHYGSCADVMHSAKPFQHGFIEPVIGLVLRDVLRALHYLHTLGYIHRSVRAKHFLISCDGTVKLSGLRTTISTIQEGTRHLAIHDHSHSTVNNICWLAPEVLAQDITGYTKSSDIYSVGIAALELATGEAPYAGLPVTQIMMLKLQGHPPMLMRRNGKEVKLSSRLASIVDRCVDPNPSNRSSAHRLLSQTFFKPHKKSNYVPLTELLRPVMPLDTRKLSSGWLDNAKNEEQATPVNSASNNDDLWTFS
ncbi:STE20-related kinase adapter protein alpha-like [Dysidea avara]|uniref:STE20-related kinase adapter protein alpha-like n=1 Tax=Dysidea avara TaxID=196820 RepID=UPI003319210F